MSKFADYEPRDPMDPRMALPEGLTIREATRGDLAALTSMTAARREKGSAASIYERLSTELGGADRVGLNVVYMATGERSTVGFARARFFDPPEDAPEGTIPRGWYLMGIYVAPEFRRQGIARALTQARLDWLASRTVVVRAFVNTQNRVSLDLLTSMGFEEETRDFSVPGITFSGGEGILLRTRLSPPSSDG